MTSLWMLEGMNGLDADLCQYKDQWNRSECSSWKYEIRASTQNENSIMGKYKQMGGKIKMCSSLKDHQEGIGLLRIVRESH